jgi:hypothetical protein
MNLQKVFGKGPWSLQYERHLDTIKEQGRRLLAEALAEPQGEGEEATLATTPHLVYEAVAVAKAAGLDVDASAVDTVVARFRDQASGGYREFKGQNASTIATCFALAALDAVGRLGSLPAGALDQSTGFILKRRRLDLMYDHVNELVAMLPTYLGLKAIYRHVPSTERVKLTTAFSKVPMLFNMMQRFEGGLMLVPGFTDKKYRAPSGLYSSSAKQPRIPFAVPTAQGLMVAAMAASLGFPPFTSTSRESMLVYLRACFSLDVGVRQFWRDPHGSLEALHAVSELLTWDRDISLATPEWVRNAVFSLGAILVLIALASTQRASLAGLGPTAALALLCLLVSHEMDARLPLLADAFLWVAHAALLVVGVVQLRAHKDWDAGLFGALATGLLTIVFSIALVLREPTAVLHLDIFVHMAAIVVAVPPLVALAISWALGLQRTGALFASAASLAWGLHRVAIESILRLGYGIAGVKEAAASRGLAYVYSTGLPIATLVLTATAASAVGGLCNFFPAASPEAEKIKKQQKEKQEQRDREGKKDKDE